jgi:hypothetical protein
MSSGEPAIKIRLKTFDLSQHEVTQKISQGSVRGVFDNAKASAEGSLARQNTCLLASHSSPCHHHCSQSSPASPARCATMTASIPISCDHLCSGSASSTRNHLLPVVQNLYTSLFCTRVSSNMSLPPSRLSKYQFRLAALPKY